MENEVFNYIINYRNLQEIFQKQIEEGLVR